MLQLELDESRVTRAYKRELWQESPQWNDYYLPHTLASQCEDAPSSMREDIERVTSVGCSKTEPTGGVSPGRQEHMRQYGYSDSNSGKGSGATRDYMREGGTLDFCAKAVVRN